jgi:hypothetical protein
VILSSGCTATAMIRALHSCEIWGSHSCDAVAWSRLKCDAVLLSEWHSTFWRMFRVRSGSFGLRACVGEGTMILYNLKKYPPNDTASHPRSVEYPGHVLNIGSYVLRTRCRIPGDCTVDTHCMMSLTLNHDFLFFRCMAQTSLEWRTAWSIC